MEKNKYIKPAIGVVEIDLEELLHGPVSAMQTTDRFGYEQAVIVEEMKVEHSNLPVGVTVNSKHYDIWAEDEEEEW